MEINFFTVWFFISPFIILHLYLKNKEYKEKAREKYQYAVEKLKEKYDELLNNSEYIDAITSQVDNIKSINKRFEIIENIKEEVLND